MSNIIQIKRGTVVPTEGGLAPYELGYVVNKYEKDGTSVTNESGGYLYIGDLESINNGNLIFKPTKIKAGYADHAGYALGAKQIVNDSNSPITVGNSTTPIYLNNGQFATCSGSTISGVIEQANMLTTAREIKVNLEQSTFSKFNGQQDITTGVTGTLPISNGGTGATNADTARTNLGIGAVATYDVLPVEKGGTGAQTAAEARSNLEITPQNIGAALASHSHEPRRLLKQSFSGRGTTADLGDSNDDLSNVKFFIVIAEPYKTYAKVSVVVPADLVGTDGYTESLQAIGDVVNETQQYISFSLSKSNKKIKINNQTSSAQIVQVYCI